LRDYLDGYYEYYEPDKIISKEFVSYNGLEGYEIVYDNLRDGDRLYEHAFYTVLGGNLAAFVFRFPWDDAGMYADIPPYVFNSIMPRITETNNWPAADLLPGTPTYPGDDFDVRIQRGVSVSILVYVNNTSKKVLLEYNEALINSGWDMYYIDNDNGRGQGRKGTWDIITEVLSDTTALLNFSYFGE